MRNVSKIIIHCSATKENQNFTAKDIDLWHKQRGFRCIGYHYVVLLDGTIQPGRPETDAGAHAKGHNHNSIGVCYIGGLSASGTPKDTRTHAQNEALFKIVKYLKEKHTHATVHGHNEFANKACPCFNVQKWIVENGLRYD